MMNSLDINVYFPKNWGQIRSVKVYNEKRKFLGKIKVGTQSNIEIAEDDEYLIFKIDFYKAKLKIDKDKSFILVYTTIRDNIYQFVDSFKRSSLQAKSFKTERELTDFSNQVYSHMQSRKLKLENKGNIILALCIALLIFISSFFNTASDNADLVFFIGMTSVVSLVLTISEIKKLTYDSYKSRMIASLAAFALSLFFMNNINFMMCVGLFTLILTIRIIAELKSLQA